MTPLRLHLLELVIWLGVCAVAGVVAHSVWWMG